MSDRTSGRTAALSSMAAKMFVHAHHEHCVSLAMSLVQGTAKGEGFTLSPGVLKRVVCYGLQSSRVTGKRGRGKRNGR
jgi:hypothetical protein